ncbi:MAG: hypothetical protein GY865_12710 [candidate division Zixibacteria bacterium]|nr:hypothetical protein [candidate division Zixibacteria bacterium]
MLRISKFQRRESMSMMHRMWMDEWIAESNRLAFESNKLHGVRCLHVCSGNDRLQHTTHTHYTLGMLI